MPETSAQPRRHVLVVGAVLALMAAALATQPALEAAWPEVAIAATAMSSGHSTTGNRGKTHDPGPWGHPLVVVVDPGNSKRYYSIGPNGRDEAGAGDDLEATPRALAWARRLEQAPTFFVLGAVLIVWCGYGPFTRTPRDPRLGRELARAAALAVLPVVLAPRMVAAVLGRDFKAFFEIISEGQSLSISVYAASFLSLALVIYLAALGWRLSRPVPELP